MSNTHPGAPTTLSLAAPSVATDAVEARLVCGGLDNAFFLSIMNTFKYLLSFCKMEEYTWSSRKSHRKKNYA